AQVVLAELPFEAVGQGAEVLDDLTAGLGVGQHLLGRRGGRRGPGAVARLGRAGVGHGGRLAGTGDGGSVPPIMRDSRADASEKAAPRPSGSGVSVTRLPDGRGSDRNNRARISLSRGRAHGVPSVV